jgi:hypothetical protein
MSIKSLKHSNTTPLIGLEVCFLRDFINRPYPKYSGSWRRQKTYKHWPDYIYDAACIWTRYLGNVDESIVVSLSITEVNI